MTVYRHILHTDDTICLHVNVIYMSSIAWRKQLATYFTKEQCKRASIMSNEATHSSRESCIWPCQVVSSYQRLTSLMTIASHANAPGFPGLSCECTRDSYFCLSTERVMQLGWNYAALFGHPEQRTGTQQPQGPRGKHGSNERWFKIIVCYRNEMMTQQWPEKETSRCLSKPCAQGWELSFSILSTKPVCLLLKVIACLCCSVFFVLPLPPSCIPCVALATASYCSTV